MGSKGDAKIMYYAESKIDGISTALYQHHEYYVSLANHLKRLGIPDCDNLCAKISFAQFKLYEKINKDLKKREDKSQRRGISLLSNPHTEDN